MAAFLAAREQPAEPILVFPNELALPLRLYYTGINAIVSVPREVSLEAYDPRNASITSGGGVSLISSTQSRAMPLRCGLSVARRLVTGGFPTVWGTSMRSLRRATRQRLRNSSLTGSPFSA